MLSLDDSATTRQQCAAAAFMYRYFAVLAQSHQLSAVGSPSQTARQQTEHELATWLADNRIQQLTGRQ